jgi:hypothetical protein
LSVRLTSGGGTVDQSCHSHVLLSHESLLSHTAPVEEEINVIHVHVTLVSSTGMKEQPRTDIEEKPSVRWS